MVSLELRPNKGMYHPGEPVGIQARIGGRDGEPAALRLTIHHLAQVVAQLVLPVQPADRRGAATVEWHPPAIAGRGYGVEGSLIYGADTPLARASTAFDVLPSWTAFPRYGFLTDFSPGRRDVAATVEALATYHLNGLQFYDWQYRHDSLVAPTREYDDPLGRRLSLATVRACIEAARARGMASMAYLAVYAASLSFWQAHPDWALRDAGGQPIPFGDRFLGLMDPSPGGPWVAHLLAEAGKALEEVGFDGLHVDQYGDPKQGYRDGGRPIDLPRAFAEFVDSCKRLRPGAPVVFNAVDGWPLERLASSHQDFAYVEIWPRTPTYRGLRALLEHARQAARGRPLVVAQYLPFGRPENIRLVNALIAACGGTRIELGDDLRLLTDPYFPKAGRAPASLLKVLRRHCDFVVRYGELIGPHAIPADGLDFACPPGLWVFPRRRAGWLACILVNVMGLEDSRWDRPHAAPQPQAASTLEVRFAEPVGSIWWACPDDDPPTMRELRWSQGVEGLRIEVPGFSHWGVVALELGQD